MKSQAPCDMAASVRQRLLNLAKEQLVVRQVTGDDHLRLGLVGDIEPKI